MTGANVDQREISKFDALAARWWDPDGEFKPLHQINPLRLGYIETRAGKLQGRKVLDVGCGGGLLAEALAAHGAAVTGLDMAESPLAVAKLHLKESGLKVDYQISTAEDWAASHAAQYDIVTCMEMLEHVPDPGAVVQACMTLVRPGGHVFFSTINRNLKAFLLAIVGAEYVLRLLPRGTHEYAKFIRPSELAAWSRQAGLELQHSAGVHYDPLSRQYRLGGNVDVNYILHCTRPD